MITDHTGVVVTTKDGVYKCDTIVVPAEVEGLFQAVVHQIRIQSEIRSRYNWPRSGELLYFSHVTYDIMCHGLSPGYMKINTQSVFELIRTMKFRNKLFREIISDNFKRNKILNEKKIYNHVSNTEVGWCLQNKIYESFISSRDIPSIIELLMAELSLTTPSLSNEVYCFIHDISTSMTEDDNLTDTTLRSLNMFRSGKYTTEEIVCAITPCSKERKFLSRLLLYHIKREGIYEINILDHYTISSI